jgi:hypothetical protein
LKLITDQLWFYKSGDKYAASARSVKGFDVYNGSLLSTFRTIGGICRMTLKKKIIPVQRSL